MHQQISRARRFRQDGGILGVDPDHLTDFMRQFLPEPDEDDEERRALLMDHRLWTVVADFYARLDASIGYVSLTRGRRAYDVDEFAVLCSEPKFFDKLMAAVNKALFEEFQDDISSESA